MKEDIKGGETYGRKHSDGNVKNDDQGEIRPGNRK